MRKPMSMEAGAGRSRARRLSLWVVMVAAAATVLWSGPASQAAPSAPPRGADCQLLLGKAAAPGGVSPLLSSQCAKAGEQLVAPRASTLLMVWYEGFNYGGASTKIYGAGGQCDTGGYGIAWVGHPWNDRIRSYKWFNKCIYSAAWEHINWGGYCIERYGQVPNAGVLAAEISSFWIASGSFPWTLCDPGN